MRPACLTALALVLIALGCDSASSDPKPKKPDPLHTYEGRVIRGWLLSLERQDYDQAAYYFAPGAISTSASAVRQAGRTPASVRLPNRGLERVRAY